MDDYELVVSNEYEIIDLEDSDLDGLVNWEEYQCGTDPTNELSVLKLNSVTALGSDDYAVVWQSVTGKTYNVVSVENLIAPSPVTEASGVVGIGPETVSTVTVSSATAFFTVELAE